MVPNIKGVNAPRPAPSNSGSPGKLHVKPPTAPIPASQKNLVFLPPNQNQQGILLGQTIFQGPDGKKFVLVQSTSGKVQANPSIPQNEVRPPQNAVHVSQNAVHVSQNAVFAPQNAALAPKMTISGNNIMNKSADISTPSYIYVPLAQKGNVGPIVSPPTTLPTLLPNNKKVSPLKPDPYLKMSDQAKSSSPSNIIQLLNMTKTALDTNLPVTTMNLNLWSQSTNQTLKLMRIQRHDVTTPKSVPGSMQSDSQPCASLSVTPSGINSPVLSTVPTNSGSDVVEGNNSAQN
ncbi:MAG: hypothetical protein GY775_00135, partial [Candidatus Scalindua sp.]|nr:hypothetical protein [Candidatus Scalindua sp.]